MKRYQTVLESFSASREEEFLATRQGGMEFPAAHVSGAATVAFSRIVRSFLFRERGKMDFSLELPSPGWNPDTDFLSEVLAATPARTGTSGA